MPDPFDPKNQPSSGEPEPYRMGFYTGYNEDELTQHEDFQQEYQDYHSKAVLVDDPLPLEAATRKTALLMFGVMVIGSVVMILRILLDFTAGTLLNILLPTVACGLLLLVGLITLIRTKLSERDDRYRRLPNILCVELFAFDVVILAATGLSNPNKVGYLIVSSLFIGIGVAVSVILKVKKSVLVIPLFLTIYSFCIGMLLQFSYLTLQMTADEVEADYIYCSLTERPEPQDSPHHYYINAPYQYVYPAHLYELPNGVTSAAEYQDMIDHLSLTNNHASSLLLESVDAAYASMLYDRMSEKLTLLKSTYNEEFFKDNNLFILIDAFPGDEVLSEQVDYIKIGRNVAGGGMKVTVEGHRQTGILQDGLPYPNTGCCFILIKVPKSVDMSKNLDYLSSDFEEKEVIFTVKKKQREEAEEAARRAEEESRAAARKTEEEAAEAIRKKAEETSAEKAE